ncbi:T9SS type A sorting domain-containing protein [Chitinophagaceae bacterium MMS25-I14]
MKIKKQLSRNLFSVLVAICAGVSSASAQMTTVFNSDFSGWGGNFNGGGCVTFSSLCVGTGLSSCSSTAPQWSRIGTPSQSGTSDLFLVGGDAINNYTEGIMANFNFVPGYTYKIHVGVKNFYNQLRDENFIPTQYTNQGYGDPGTLRLYAATNIQQTPAALSNVSNCQEHYLENPNNPGQVDPFWTYNQSQYNVPNTANPVIDRMTDIIPAYASASNTAITDYTIQYTPSIFNNQIVLHPTSNHHVSDYNRYMQALLTISYVKIETDSSKVCDANFTYSVNSLSANTVTFTPDINKPQGFYTWNLNWGIPPYTVVGGNPVTQQYPYNVDWKICLSYANTAGQNCATVCKTFCPRYFPTNPPTGKGGCDANFSYSVNTAIPDVVNCTANNLFSNVYDWDFGDGTVIINNSPYMTHTYANPGSYIITLATSDPKTNTGCKQQMSVCLSDFGTTSSSGKPAAVTTITPGSRQFEIENLYPNPTSGDLKFDLNTSKSGNIRINVYDAMGRIVDKTIKNVTEGRQTIIYDLSTVAPGIYNMEVISEESKVYRKISKY